MTALIAAWRERRGRPMGDRESVVAGTLALGYFLAALGVALLLPWEESADPLTVAWLVALFVLSLRIHFEVGAGWVSAAELVFVPLLFAVPLPLVPLLVPACFAIEELPDLLSGRSHAHRWMNWLADSWFVVGPVLLLGLLAPGDPQLGFAWVYALALAAQVAIGILIPVVREQLVGRIVFRDELLSAATAYQVNVLLAPIGFAIAYAAALNPVWLLALAPLVGLLAVLSRLHAAQIDRLVNEHKEFWERFIADSRSVERSWTASRVGEDWRSLPELTLAVAQELGLEYRLRFDIAFAAHDAARHYMPRTAIVEPTLSEKQQEWWRPNPLEAERRVELLSSLLKRRVLAARGADHLLAELADDGGLRRQAALVRASRERWDGAGQPDELQGEEIPLGARIIACCEGYSALTSGRAHGPPMSREAALEELGQAAGSKFDPRVVEALHRALEREEFVPHWRPAAPSWLLPLDRLCRLSQLRNGH